MKNKMTTIKLKKKLDKDQRLFREEMLSILRSTGDADLKKVMFQVHRLYLNKFVDYKKIVKDYDNELKSLMLIDESLYHAAVDYVHNFILRVATEKALEYELYETVENIKRFDEEFFRNYY